MSDLIEKIRRARESSIDAGNHRLTIRRPTDLDALDMQYSSVRDAIKGTQQFVVGWDLREIDLVPGGTDVPVLFDSELFAEWVKDQPELWAPIVEGVRSAYKAHADKLKGDLKNS